MRPVQGIAARRHTDADSPEPALNARCVNLPLPHERPDPAAEPRGDRSLDATAVLPFKDVPEQRLADEATCKQPRAGLDLVLSQPVDDDVGPSGAFHRRSISHPEHVRQPCTPVGRPSTRESKVSSGGLSKRAWCAQRLLPPPSRTRTGRSASARRSQVRSGDLRGVYAVVVRGLWPPPPRRRFRAPCGFARPRATCGDTCSTLVMKGRLPLRTRILESCASATRRVLLSRWRGVRARTGARTRRASAALLT